MNMIFKSTTKVEVTLSDSQECFQNFTFGETAQDMIDKSLCL